MKKFLIIFVVIVVIIFMFPQRVKATSITEFYRHYNERLEENYVNESEVGYLFEELPPIDLDKINQLIEEYQGIMETVDKEIRTIETFNDVLQMTNTISSEERDTFALYVQLKEQETALQQITEITPYVLIAIDNNIKNLTYQINKEEVRKAEVGIVDVSDKLFMMEDISNNISLAEQEKEDKITEHQAKEIEREQLISQLKLDSQLTPYSLPLTKYQLFKNPENFRISSTMAPRIHPIRGVLEHHSGVDFAGPGGSEILFPFNRGVVIKNSYDNIQGNYIVTYLEPDITLHFLHLQERAPWQEGDTVTLNDIVGLVGTTGSSTGNHLHLTMKIKGKLKSIID